MIDLCSGLGGASEAFCDRNDWIVVRIENNQLITRAKNPIRYTYEYDINTNILLRFLEELIPPVGPSWDMIVIWASPPCLEFSLAYASPKSIAIREGRNYRATNRYQQAVELVRRCLEIIGHVTPTYWAIENVRGACVDFVNEGFGAARQIVGPFALWGNFPYLDVNRSFSHSKADHDVWSSDPLRANKKAKIPLELSLAFFKAVTTQQTLF